MDNIKITDEELYSLYKNGTLTKIEFCVMTACNKPESFLDALLMGGGEYKLYTDQSVDTRCYFTNSKGVLGAFYKLYNKYPNYKLDKILNNWLLTNSNKPGYVYYILHYINLYLDDKKNGRNTFKLENLSKILKNCSCLIKENKTRFTEFKSYEGRDKPNGYLGVFEDYNKTFKRELGIDLFRNK